MRQLSTRDQMTQKLTTIGHIKAHTAQSAINGPEMTMYNNSNEKTNGLIHVQKTNKNKYLTHKQTTTTELQAPDINNNFNA